MLFSNFDFLQQNFAVISKTFLDNSDSAIVSVLSHSWGPSVLLLRLDSNVGLRYILMDNGTGHLLRIKIFTLKTGHYMMSI